MGATMNCQDNWEKHWIQLQKTINIPGHPTLLLSTYNSSLHAQKYLFSLSSTDQSCKFYEQRKIQQPNVVSLYHYQVLNHLPQCMNIFINYLVITERLPFRLFDLNAITKQQGYYILYQTLIGYSYLYQTFNKCFFINSMMIAFNNNGNVKVWLNQIWAFNEVSRIAAKVDFMIDQIINVVQESVKKGDSKGFDKQFHHLIRINKKAFSNILNIVHRFNHPNFFAKKTLCQRLKIVANDKMGLKSIGETNDSKTSPRESVFIQTPKIISKNHQSFQSIKNNTPWVSVISTPKSSICLNIKNQKTERLYVREIQPIAQSHSKNSSLDKLKNQQQLFKVFTENTQITINNSKPQSPNTTLSYINTPIPKQVNSKYNYNSYINQSKQDFNVKNLEQQKKQITNMNKNKKSFSVPLWNKKKKQQQMFKQKQSQICHKFQEKNLNYLKEQNQKRQIISQVIQNQMCLKNDLHKYENKNHESKQSNYDLDEQQTQRYTEIFKFYLQSYKGEGEIILENKDKSLKNDDIQFIQKQKLRSQLDIIHESEGEY